VVEKDGDQVDLISISKMLKGADILYSDRERGLIDHVPLFTTLDGDYISTGIRLPAPKSTDKKW
jgi:hypothetical protein